jgi:gluconate 2-dehydrogenase gamma chain
MAAGAGGTSLVAGCSRIPSNRWRFFTAEEAELVEAIIEQIIPADQDPGAKQAGVINFIDKQLVGFLKRFQSRYRMGLAGAQETSQAMFGKKFIPLAWDEQTTVLKALESGKAAGKTWSSQSSGEFFQMIRDHTMAGFYGSPRHGGNRNYVSFKLLKLDYPPIIGRNRPNRTDNGQRTTDNEKRTTDNGQRTMKNGQ